MNLRKAPTKELHLLYKYYAFSMHNVKKDRFVHHTSFLWNYKAENMQLLRHPKKTPTYRQNRDHTLFITKMQDHFSCREKTIKQIICSLEKKFAICKTTLQEELHHLDLPHRKSVMIIERS